MITHKKNAHMKETDMMDKHEDTLIFLEDNIAKLAKLKVASRAKYKEYDEKYMGYLTAIDVDDDVRTEMYGEMVKNCRLFLQQKLKEALNENPELKNNSVVAEYIELMK